MTSKIKIKLGSIEIEYEGSEDFLKKEIPELLLTISKLHKESGIALGITTENAPQSQEVNGTVIGTTSTIAGKLNVSTGPDLALAAAAKLILGDGSSSFNRDLLLKEMQSATSYFKKSFLNNLSQTLNSMIKNGKFVEIAANKYSLSAPTKKELEASLAS